MSTLKKGSPEWREAKDQARKDLDHRLANGLPHSDKPLSKADREAAAEGDTLAPKAPRTRKPKAPKAPKTE